MKKWNKPQMTILDVVATEWNMMPGTLKKRPPRNS